MPSYSHLKSPVASGFGATRPSHSRGNKLLLRNKLPFEYSTFYSGESSLSPVDEFVKHSYKCFVDDRCEIHRELTLKGAVMKELELSEIRELIDSIGPTLVLLASGCTARGMTSKWMSHQAAPTRDQMDRLVVLKEVFDKVSRHESPDVARAWLIGSNCHDMTLSPVEALREGSFDEVSASAARLVNDTWG
jgi:hypothetical protein